MWVHLRGSRSLYHPNCDISSESIKQIPLLPNHNRTDNSQDASRYYKVSDYDQEIPQAQTADQPTAP